MNVCKSINGRKLNGPLGGKIGKSSCLNFLIINLIINQSMHTTCKV